jgi:glycosyltransferase involved in cell wall biosynthesis
VRICIIGKFPPIQGGVSMRTYWSAHELAARGHDVHVVTNAKEACPPFRMHMRPQDWSRCEAVYGAGSVTVHWSDPADRSQSYIPMASAFVSKLAGIAGSVHGRHPFDVILSHYMEPYGVAAHLAAQIAGVPHVMRMAGSDAGRLWHHPQFQALYDHVLRSAEVVIAAGAVAERAIQRGIDPDRIALGGGFSVPEDLFTPDGPVLDLATLRKEVEQDPELSDLLWGEFAGDRPYFGVYGKLGESKGSFALLAAMQRLKSAGLDVGLVALAHGGRAIEAAFRSRARKLGIADRVVQFPFLPHWRVPDFLRGCVAVCCLEQNFPIGFHTPIIPREVLLCGTCLVGSTEVIRKLSRYGRLPHGYGCIAIEDVNDTEALSERLAAIVDDRRTAAAVGMRGCTFARELQRGVRFPQTLERILESAIARQRVPSAIGRSASDAPAKVGNGRFAFTALAAAALQETGGDRAINRPPIPLRNSIDLAQAREVLAAVERGIVEGDKSLQRLAPAVRAEIAVAAAECDARKSVSAQNSDPLFRLRIKRWAIDDDDLGALVPVQNPQLRVIEFDYDVSEFVDAPTAAELPAVPTRSRSYLVAFAQSDDAQREPLLVDGLTARILQLSDGTRTVADIVSQLDCHSGNSEIGNNLKWIENLFVSGLIHLQDTCLDPACEELGKL